jgi:hypothetical protein
MANGNSVTLMLPGLKAGNDKDIGRLWDRYFERLVRPDDRDDLWKILSTITTRKAVDMVRHQTRHKPTLKTIALRRLEGYS